MNDDGGLTTLIYAVAIALVSGGYSLLVGLAGIDVSFGMSGPQIEIVTSVWIMLLLGIVVLVHGVALLRLSGGRFGTISGLLMIGYSIVMILNQALVGTGIFDGSGTAASSMGSGTVVGTSWDGGVVALAVLMLISGILMARTSVSV
jgi:hypothetical protein